MISEKTTARTVTVSELVTKDQKWSASVAVLK